MSLLPKIKRCPRCNIINFISVNGISYHNDFQSLKGWLLKKIFHCRKCKIKLGLFSNSQNMQESLIWIDFFKCEDSYYNILLKLEKEKKKCIKYKFSKKYNNILKEIQNIQNKIRIDQTKLKIKFKIQNKNMLVGHVF